MFSILTVDDSACMRQLVALPRANAGSQVFAAADGSEALDCARENQVELVLTNQNMPNLVGVGSATALRELPADKITSMFILTAGPSDAVRLCANDAGVTGWIEKPFAFQHRIDLVDSFFVGKSLRAM